MTALEIFKTADGGILDTLKKYPWGSLATPALVGAGGGALGLGLSEAASNGPEGETDADKTKRILNKGLMGGALGGLAGAGGGVLYNAVTGNTSAPATLPQGWTGKTIEESNKPVAAAGAVGRNTLMTKGLGLVGLGRGYKAEKADAKYSQELFDKFHSKLNDSGSDPSKSQLSPMAKEWHTLNRADLNPSTAAKVKIMSSQLGSKDFVGNLKNKNFIGPNLSLDGLIANHLIEGEPGLKDNTANILSRQIHDQYIDNSATFTDKLLPSNSKFKLLRNSGNFVQDAVKKYIPDRVNMARPRIVSGLNKGLRIGGHGLAGAGLGFGLDAAANHIYEGARYNQSDPNTAALNLLQKNNINISDLEDRQQMLSKLYNSK